MSYSNTRFPSTQITYRNSQQEAVLTLLDYCPHSLSVDGNLTTVNSTVFSDECGGDKFHDFLTTYFGEWSGGGGVSSVRYVIVDIVSYYVCFRYLLTPALYINSCLIISNDIPTHIIIFPSALPLSTSLWPHPAYGIWPRFRMPFVRSVSCQRDSRVGYVFVCLCLCICVYYFMECLSGFILNCESKHMLCMFIILTLML